MSLDIKAFSFLNLSLHDSIISMYSLFTSPTEYYRNIDLDYIGSISNFSNFCNLTPKNHIIAFIKENQDRIGDLSKIQKLLEPNNSLQIICSSKDDDFQNVLVLIPARNSYFCVNYSEFEFVLMKFKVSELCGDNFSNYLSHIDSIKFSLSQIQSKMSRTNNTIRDIEKELEILNNSTAKVHSSNCNMMCELSEIKIQIKNLHHQFESFNYENDGNTPNLRCIYCNINLKSVLYKPCGHLISCQNCFTLNLNFISCNFSKKNKSQLVCEVCKRKVTESVSVKLEAYTN